MIANKLRDLLDQKLGHEDFEDFFLIEILEEGQKISVFVDADQGVNPRKCAQLSRYLEAYLDEIAFSGGKYVLEVSSPGVDRPLIIPRQFIKNMGRKLEIVNTEGEKISGKLVSANEAQIKIEYRDKVKEGKKKVNIIKQIDIPHDKIVKAKVKISFK